MSKTKCIPIYKNKNIQISNLPSISLDANNTEYLKAVKNLELIFNNTLSWNIHIYASIGKLYEMLRTLKVTQYFTPLNIRLLLAKTYQIPSLLYCCEIYVNCDVECTRELNVAFNDVARYVFGVKRHRHVSECSFKTFNMSFKFF